MKKLLMVLMAICCVVGAGAVENSILAAAPSPAAVESGYTVIDFWGPGCPPCRKFLPVFDQVSQEMSGKVVFKKINTQEDNATARSYNVQSIPTIILLKEGREVKRFVGYRDAGSFRSWLESAIR